MSDDQQIIVPANRADDCLTEQPPQCDAAAAACPVQPPKDEDTAACPVQSPNDDAACPVPPPNDEAEIMDVVMSSNDDDAASPAPPPNNDAAIMSDVVMSSQDDDDAASPAPPPNTDAAKMSDVVMSSQDDDDAGLSLPSSIDAGPATPPKEDAIPSMVKDEPGCSNAKRSAATDDDDAGVDFKKEIKHETIDLGNDTYFYDDNNKAILIKGPPKVGFDRGLEPDHIVGATEQDGKLMFLIAWKNSEVADLLESTVVYDRAPQIAIQFFEARLRYCPTVDKD